MKYEITMKKVVIWFTLGIVAIAIMYILGFIHNYYNVWSMQMSGKANLAKAEQDRKILVAQANAEFEAAKARAKAIEIMGQKAKQYPEYRYQEFIAAFAEALNRGDIEKVIFVPTEANIPIVEPLNTK